MKTIKEYITYYKVNISNDLTYPACNRHDQCMQDAEQINKWSWLTDKIELTIWILNKI